MNIDLKYIKEKYGEKMMHLCKSLFPTILEKEGYLFKLLKENFEYNKFLYDDIMNNNMENQFKNYIYGLTLEKENKIETQKTPQELLDEAGYILYECQTESDIQSFKKYYQDKEKLCTFNGGRLGRCHVFFAIKKNVNEIKRENFKFPDRQDDYGTSVISIQFTKGNINTLSIKNRYNHTVFNPDATYSNNLENIIKGLTKSFEKHYNLNINQNNKNNFELPGYVKANDKKFYKYNHEINNIYYCPNNVIIDNFEVKRNYQENEKYLIIDYFILDLKEKRIYLYDKAITDSFITELKNIKKIEIKKDKETKNKTIDITLENNTKATIKINKENQIISYENKEIKRIRDDFLYKNKTMEYLNLENVIKIGNYFLIDNKTLKELKIPNVQYIGFNFLCNNTELEEINIPKILNIRDYFLYYNNLITYIDMPKLLEVGSCFLAYNKIINKINTPKLIKIGNNFLYNNKSISEIDLPNTEYIEDYFLYNNEIINNINLPKVKIIKNHFMSDNKKLKSINLPEIELIKDDFLSYNSILNEFKAPKLTKIEDDFLSDNKTITELNLESLKSVGNYFLKHNNSLKLLNTPNLNNVGKSFLEENNTIENITLLKLKSVGSQFLYSNNKLETLYLPNVIQIGSHFLYTNNTLIEINLPSLERIGNLSLYNITTQNIFIPNIKEIGKNCFGNNKKIKKKILKKL